MTKEERAVIEGAIAEIKEAIKFMGPEGYTSAVAGAVGRIEGVLATPVEPEGRPKAGRR